MNRRLTLLTVCFAAASLGASVPAVAAKPKPKPKPITGSYTVQLPPDPTKEAGSLQGQPACSGLSPLSVHNKAFTVPAAGTLTVKLDGDDPLKGAAPAGLDWDLYLSDAGGVLSESDGATGHEEVVATFKKKTAVDIEICNLDGLPNATVAYTFTYS